MRLMISAAIAAACIFASPARATDEVDSSKKIITSVELAFKIAANPVAAFDAVDMSIVRTGERPGAARFQKVYDAFAQTLYPDAFIDKDTTEAFGVLRARFADPAVLKAFYDSSRQSLVGKIAGAAIKGMVADILRESAPIFEKPLPLAAAQAGDWYFFSCYDTEVNSAEAPNTDCVKYKNFPARFKEAYGMEPSGSTAYVLSWLYRRHMEGGTQLVSEWQRIGKDLGKDSVAKR